MAVNTAALKTFAPAMRRQLMEAVGRKLDLLLNSQTPDTLSTYAKQIAELRDEQEKSREQLLERVAYTWFNRLCALRYLDAKGWHPFGCKVLMSADGSETQPELLKLMRSGSLPDDLKAFTNEQRLNQLLDGQIPTAIPGGDAQGEVYRELVLAACRSYHHLLPDLFEGLDDASELLLPDDLLTEGSIAGSFRSAISDSDCEDVEIIGWLYQFYISEKKDEVIGKVVKSEDIPAATQLFTPNWIVKYMVQNTIGAQWLATYPDSPLRDQMEFYIEPVEQTDEVKAQLAEITPKSLNPEELTLMDPACGSGHILVEAYEIFKAIYLEQGYQPREIPRLIFEKNLFGLDIDKRAAQLTIFALMMKGRMDDRRLFERMANLNVMALQDSRDFEVEDLFQASTLLSHGISINDLKQLKQVFKEATTFGSLIQIPLQLRLRLDQIRKLIIESKEKSLFSQNLEHLSLLVKQASMLSTEYEVVLANPPFLNAKYYTTEAKQFITDYYKDYKANLFSAFIFRGLLLASPTGRTGFVTPFVWMFISSFETLRAHILNSYSITSLVKPSYTSFFESAIVSLVAFVIEKSTNDHRGTYFDLGYLGSAKIQPKKLKDGIRSSTCSYKYFSCSEDFRKTPGARLAYWLSEDERRLYEIGSTLDSASKPRKGMDTGDNNTFLRMWWEVSNREMSSNTRSSHQKWYPYNKGGDFRRWYGNREYVVNWQSDGASIRARLGNKKKKPTIRNSNYFFDEGFTWSTVSSGNFSARYAPHGSIFDNGGCTLFCADEATLFEIGGLINSKVAQRYLDFLAPTVNFQPGDIGKILYIKPQKSPPTYQLMTISHSDWDAYERSWDFPQLHILKAKGDTSVNLPTSFSLFTTQNKATIAEAKQLEEENNSLFIDSYGLANKLNAEVAINQISLTINPAYRYGGDGTEEEKSQRFQRDSMAELLSYATGCMMGRYSLDHPGLILADSLSNQDKQLAAYEDKVGKPISEIQFKPDADAIIPVLDGEWFEDDIVARTREFLKVTFPESSVAENLRFIEDSIGKDIRKYFCKDFYKDHLQTYKKRPIYWMVQSPKAGFACLIYLHRYTPDTLLQVLNNYFRPYLQKLEARQEQLERDQNNDSLPKREQTAARKEAEKITKVLKECQAWEQDALMPLAQQRIELDLDDGVKVNYLKLKDVLAKIPGLAAKGG